MLPKIVFWTPNQNHISAILAKLFSSCQLDTMMLGRIFIYKQMLFCNHHWWVLWILRAFGGYLVGIAKEWSGAKAVSGDPSAPTRLHLMALICAILAPPLPLHHQIPILSKAFAPHRFEEPQEANIILSEIGLFLVSMRILFNSAKPGHFSAFDPV